MTYSPVKFSINCLCRNCFKPILTELTQSLGEVNTAVLDGSRTEGKGKKWKPKSSRKKGNGK